MPLRRVICLMTLGDILGKEAGVHLIPNGWIFRSDTYEDDSPKSTHPTTGGRGGGGLWWEALACMASIV